MRTALLVTSVMSLSAGTTRAATAQTHDENVKRCFIDIPRDVVRRQNKVDEWIAACTAVIESGQEKDIQAAKKQQANITEEMATICAPR